ncbi:MAG: VOC family protein [Actinomycetota bacterium]
MNMDSVVHFEIPADDVGRAASFYSDSFGWNCTPVEGMPYTMVQTGEMGEHHMPRDPGVINGGMLQRREPITSPVITIAVDDMDSALEKLAAAGGEVVKPKFPVGEMGFSAYFKDTEGNLLGLFQSRRPQG